MEGTILLGESEEYLLERVAVRCEMLLLDEPPPQRRSSQEAGVNSQAEFLSLRVAHKPFRLPLYARPGGLPKLWITQASAGECVDPLHVQVLRRQGRWVQVEIRGPSVLVRAWVPSNALRQSPNVACGVPCCTNVGKTVVATVANGATQPEPNPPFVRKGTVLAGTSVSTGRDGTIWARVERDSEVTVKYRRGDPWVLLLKVPGTEQAEIYRIPPAFVPAESVLFAGAPSHL